MDPAVRALGNVALLTLAPTLDLDLRPYSGPVKATIEKENEGLLSELRAEVFGTKDEGEPLPPAVAAKVLEAVQAAAQPGLRALTEELANADCIAYLVALEKEDMKGGGPLTRLLSDLADIESTLD
ncbi:MAG TPA: hypothetical protein VJB16_00200 [archaeon]|nr:hypothetical protein [archaeon]